MKNLNIYITEAWSGVKKHTNNAEIEAWCKEMRIKNYTINDKGEIDVNGDVNLRNKDLKELPYKFGKVSGSFDLFNNKDLISLKNCPNRVDGEFFSCKNCSILKTLEGCPKEVKGDLICNWCDKLISLEGCPKKVGKDFYCNTCINLESLKGCPKEVNGSFYCRHCKRKFPVEEVKSLCKVKGSIDLF